MSRVEEQSRSLEETELVGALRVERHGIDQIPDSERWARPKDLFYMWAGASFQVEYFVYGVTLMTFGFSLSQAIILTVVGNLSFLLLGLTSLQGPQAGTTAMTINRAPFGLRGSRVIAVFNWLTQVGFETEGLVLVVLAGESLSSEAGLHVGTLAKVLFLVGGLCIQLILPFFGHEVMLKGLKMLAIPFVALYIVVVAFIAPKVQAVPHHANWSTWLAGLAFTIALSGLGWTENGNDYSRYLPRDAKRTSIVGWVFLGTAVPEIFVMLIGVLVGTYSTSLATNSNPFAAIVHGSVVPSALVVPVLAVSIAQLFAINSLDLYSSGVTLQTIGFRLRRWQAVLVDTCIAGALTVYAIFDSSFNTLLKDFADVVIVWIAPWFAIYLLDWVLRHRRYDDAALQLTSPNSRYFGGRFGFRWTAVVAQLAGMFAALEGLSPTFKMPSWLTLFASHTGGGDISIFSGIAVAAVVYLCLELPKRARSVAAA